MIHINSKQQHILPETFAPKTLGNQSVFAGTRLDMIRMGKVKGLLLAAQCRKNLTQDIHRFRR